MSLAFVCLGSQSLDILLPENAEAKFLSVAPRNVAYLLDTVTGCKVIDFRTDVKTDITRLIGVKCVEANLRNFVG